MRDLEKRLAALEAATRRAPTEAQRWQAWVDNMTRDPWEPFWAEFSDAELELFGAEGADDPALWTAAERAAVEHYERVCIQEVAAARAAVERGVIDVYDSGQGPVVYDHVELGSWADHYCALRMRDWLAPYCTEHARPLPRTSGELLALLRSWPEG